MTTDQKSARVWFINFGKRVVDDGEVYVCQSPSINSKDIYVEVVKAKDYDALAKELERLKDCNTIKSPVVSGFGREQKGLTGTLQPSDVDSFQSCSQNIQSNAKCAECQTPLIQQGTSMVSAYEAVKSQRDEYGQKADEIWDSYQNALQKMIIAEKDRDAWREMAAKLAGALEFYADNRPCEGIEIEFGQRENHGHMARVTLEAWQAFIKRGGG